MHLATDIAAAINKTRSQEIKRDIERKQFKLTVQYQVKDKPSHLSRQQSYLFQDAAIGYVLQRYK